MALPSCFRKIKHESSHFLTVALYCESESYELFLPRYRAFTFVGFQSVSVTVGLLVVFFLFFLVAVMIALVWVLPVVLPHYGVDYPVVIPAEWYAGLFWLPNGNPGFVTVTCVAFIVP